MSQPYIADFDLERLALGELSEGEAQALQGALDKDAEALARFQAIAASNEDILKAHPVADVKREVESRLRQLKGNEALEAKASFSQQLMRWAVVAACAVFAVVMVRPGLDEDPGVRMKGMESYIVVHKVVGNGLERLNAGVLAQEGDRLQLSIVGAVDQYAVVCSVDGNGQVTQHFPVGGESTKLVESPFNLPNSYELDDAPGFERFVLFTSSEPLSVEAMLGYVRGMSLAADASMADLPKGVYQASWVVKKP
tara:strand:- start:192 stop:950 length:759 start_codon:yes stop_codon:yes gene_type:complete